jgi:hypothetical protein
MRARHHGRVSMLQIRALGGVRVRIGRIEFAPPFEPRYDGRTC